MIDTENALKALLSVPTTVTLSPRYEGANIGTYIGFKHVNYLIEEAVLKHFQSAGLPVGRLYEQHGLGFDLVTLESRLRGGIFVDDEAVVDVTPATADGDSRFGFTVSIHVARDGVPKKAVTSAVTAVLRYDEDERRLPDRTTPPAALSRFTVLPGGGMDGQEAPIGADALSRLVSGGTSDADPVLDRLLAGRNGYGWRLRIPYPYVHFYSRLQMSSYLRLMEEAKHRFVDARGISIGQLLAERNWIPAVTHSAIEILGEALLEEDLYTVYTVESVFRRLLYTARMDCHVLRERRLIPVATGTITHGYGVVENGNQARVIEWDDRVDRALRGTGGLL